MISIEGRTAIVTGASGGMGQAICRVLADRGARVHGLGRQPFEGGEGVQTHLVEVGDASAVEQVIRQIGDRDGVSVLVLAAGLQVQDRRLEQLTPDSWDELLAVNLSHAFYCIHAAYPYLRETGGDVLLFSSGSALWPDLSGPAYQASKLGLLGFARGSAFEEHQHGIRFTTIFPGMTDTPMLDRRPVPIADEIRRHALRPQDIAELCVHLISLRPEVHIPEVAILPAAIQAMGKLVPTPPKSWPPGEPA
jgi:NAD(P)-dependent dehydrogenase (short-subunit alcohol dehydrogenase family)